MVLTLAWTVKDQGSIPHWGTNVSTHYVSNCIIWASVGSKGRPGAHLPTDQNFLNFMQFVGKFVCWRSSWRVGAPSYEESWFDIGIGSIKITLFLDMQWINVFSTVGPSQLCSFNTNAATKNRIQKMTSRGLTLRRMLARKMTSLLNNWWVI